MAKGKGIVKTLLILGSIVLFSGGAYFGHAVSQDLNLDKQTRADSLEKFSNTFKALYVSLAISSKHFSFSSAFFHKIIECLCIISPPI